MKPSSETTKNPAKVAAGKAAMRARWGAPRILRLDGLTEQQRDEVTAMVATYVLRNRARGIS